MLEFLLAILRRLVVAHLQLWCCFSWIHSCGMSSGVWCSALHIHLCWGCQFGHLDCLPPCLDWGQTTLQTSGFPECHLHEHAWWCIQGTKGVASQQRYLHGYECLQSWWPDQAFRVLSMW